jgi:hypothetical protein
VSPGYLSERSTKKDSDPAVLLRSRIHGRSTPKPHNGNINWAIWRWSTNIIGCLNGSSWMPSLWP